jgi:ATPases of the AAA+ class
MSKTEANDDTESTDADPPMEDDSKSKNADGGANNEKPEPTSKSTDNDTIDFDPTSKTEGEDPSRWEGDEPIENFNGYTDWEYNWESTPDKRFEDIGGYESVKERLEKKVIKPHKDEKGLYDHFNIDEIDGVLFHGPPGTGKTLFARALANELNRTFIEVGQADLTHNHINKSPQMIKTLFMEAELQRAVVLIDEADTLLTKRGTDNSHAEDSKITNTFLTWLTKENTTYIVILTTNFKENMDKAALRNGRIDAEFEIGLPNLEARKKILKVKLLNVPHSFTDDHIRYFAKNLKGKTGADIESLINQAKFIAVEREGRKLIVEDVQQAYVEMED